MQMIDLVPSHINQGTYGLIVTVPAQVGPVSNPNDPAQVWQYGYRNLPPLQAGYVRVTDTFVDGTDGMTAVPSVADMTQADYDAATQAAAQAAAIAQTAANTAAQQAASASYSAAVAMVVPLAQQYRALLREYFGPGAETNAQVTQAAVMGYFLQLDATKTITAQQTADGAMLQTIFQVIEPLANDGVTLAPNTWSATFWNLIP